MDPVLCCAALESGLGCRNSSCNTPPVRVRGHGPGSAARRRRLLAALARLDLHVGELLNFRCLANVVEDGERLQVLGDTARRR